MAAGGKDLGALIAQIGADMNQWDKAFGKMDRDMRRMQNRAAIAAQKMGQAFDRAANRMGAIGKTLSTRVTLPLIAAGGASLKMAADFDTSMRKITGLVGVAADQVNLMRDGVMELSGETARSPQELANAMFFVTSAGLRGAEAMDVLESSAKASAAGLGETKVVADLVTSAVNAYGSDVLSAADATDILVGAVREGKAEAPQLAASMGQVLPIASNLGVTFDQVGAAIAGMTRTGTDARMAAVQLRQILASLLQPSQQAEAALDDMGTSSAKLRKTLREDGLISVLGFLRDQMVVNEQAMAQVFPNIRALSGALDLMGASADDTVEIFNRLKDASGLTEEAFLAAQGPAFKFQLALAKLKIAATQLGTALFPVLEEILNVVTPLLDKLSSLNDESLRTTIVIGAVVAAIGPLLIAISTLMKSISLLVGLMFSKFVILSALFASVVVAGQYMVDNWDKIAIGMEVGAIQITQAMNHMARSVIAAVKWMVETIINSTPQGMLTELFGFNLGEATTGLAGFDAALRHMDETVDMTTQLLDESLDQYNQLEWGSIGDSASRALELAKNTIINSLQGIISSEQIQSLLDELNAMLSGAGSGAGETEDDQTSNPSFKDSPIGFASIDTNNYKENVDRILSENGRFLKSFETVKKKTIDMSDALQTAISGAVVSFAESMGEMIAAGFKGGNFFDMLLGLAADFAVQFGKIIVSMGVAALQLPQILTNPVGAIAAGGALVALGTALKGLVSSKTGSGSASASGGTSFEASARSESAGDQEVVFRIGNKELVGVLQQGNKDAGRVGRRVNVF